MDIEGEPAEDPAEELSAHLQQQQQQQETSFPGDMLFQLDNFISRRLVLGLGIIKRDQQLVASRCGLMRYKPPSTFFLDPLTDSYSPGVGDDVIGLIIRRKGLDISEHYYLVDLGKNVDHTIGVLPVLAFKGATKRYRPNLQKGDLVYCRIRRAMKNGPVRLTCIGDNLGQECWGPLRRTGNFYRASVAFVKRCLTTGSAENAMIAQIGEKIPFESAVGVNGRIWMYTGYEKSQNLIYSMFRDAEFANGNSEAINRITRKALTDITCIHQDIPLEDNTQYWITRVV